MAENLTDGLRARLRQAEDDYACEWGDQSEIATVLRDAETAIEMLGRELAASDAARERSFDAGYHARQQDLAFVAMTRGKLDAYNDAVGPAVDEHVCRERVHGLAGKETP